MKTQLKPKVLLLKVERDLIRTAFAPVKTSLETAYELALVACRDLVPCRFDFTANASLLH